MRRWSFRQVHGLSAKSIQLIGLSTDRFLLASIGTFACSMVSPSVHWIVHRYFTGFRFDCTSVNSMVSPPSLWSALLFTGYSAFISLVAASMVLPPSPWFVSEVNSAHWSQYRQFPTSLDWYFCLFNGKSIGSLDCAPLFHWLSFRLYIREFNGPSAKSMVCTSVHWIFRLHFASCCINGPSAKSMVCQRSQFCSLVSVQTVSY